MKSFLPLLLSSLLFCSCDKSSESAYDYSIDNTIYSSSKSTKFEEIVFILTPKFSENLPIDKKFIVTDMIRNIKVNINGTSWGLYNSDVLDTVGLSNTIYNQFKVTEDKTSYLIIAKLTPQTPKNLTAGEFADYLNAFNTLSPGDYVCEISELKLIKQNNDTLTVKPRIFQHVEILADTKSAYLGEFEINIK